MDAQEQHACANVCCSLRHWQTFHLLFVTWRAHQLCLRVPAACWASQGDRRLLALKDRKCVDRVLIHVAMRSNSSACFHLRLTAWGIGSKDSAPPASSYRERRGSRVLQNHFENLYISKDDQELLPPPSLEWMLGWEAWATRSDLCGARKGTQCVVHTKQALYQLNCIPKPNFAFGGEGSSRAIHLREKSEHRQAVNPSGC